MKKRIVHDGNYYVIYNFDPGIEYSVYVYFPGVCIVQSSFYAKNIEELRTLLLRIDPDHAELILAREGLQRKLEGTP